MTTPTYYIFAMLIWATSPPTMFQEYAARILPASYSGPTGKTDCENAAVWWTANTPKVPAPSPDTKIVFVCIPW